MPGSHDLEISPGRSAQHRDFAEPALPGTVAPDMQQNLNQLSVVNYTMWAHNAC